jgi:hypothetical protein
MENIAKLQAAVEMNALAGSDANFARSLLDQYSRKGSLSGSQFKWVNIISERASQPKPQAAVLDAKVSRVFELFASAKSHGIKYPKIRLEAEGVSVVLSLAGDRSKYCGQVQVTDGGRFGSNQYFGRIDTDGKLTDGRDMTAGVRKLLVELAANPEQIAAVHGHRTGDCCFCGLPLTDGRSVAMGYGPKCAKNFGLKWGKAKVETAISLAA